MANQSRSEQRREDPGQRIGELNDTVIRLDETVEYIREGYNLVTEENKAYKSKLVKLDNHMQSLDKRLSERMSEMETTLKVILEKLEKRLMETTTNENLPPPINGTSQVFPTSSEQIRNDRDLGYRFIDMWNENRDSLLKKVETPMFSEYNPYGWIARVERYFGVTRYDPEARMDLVIELEDDALSWYKYEVEHRPFVDWSEFKRRMLARFAEFYEKTSGKRLFGIQQTGQQLSM